MKYRIIEQSPGSFQVQRKGGLWWVNAFECSMSPVLPAVESGWLVRMLGVNFTTSEAASDRLNELLARKAFKRRVVREAIG